MKATIQVEDPRGENISPMWDQIKTADCVLNVSLFNEWINISEENSDMSAEGADVELLGLVQEFVSDCENNVLRERKEVSDPMKRSQAEDELPQLLRLQAALDKCRAVTDAAISRVVAFIALDDAEWKRTVDAKNKAEAEERRRRAAEGQPA